MGTLRTAAFFNVGLLVATSCATAPQSRQNYSGRTIVAFAESLGYEAEPRFDPSLITKTVKIVPSKRTMKELFVDRAGPNARRQKEVARLDQQFKAWCEVNGAGTPILGAPARFATAAQEYVAQRAERQPVFKTARVSSSACVDKNGTAIAGYLNVADANIAFYDQPTLSAFIEQFERAGEERLRKRKEDAAAEVAAAVARSEAEAAARRQRDPNPKLEPRRQALVEAVAAVLRDHAILDRASYIDSCVVRFTTGKGAANIFLGTLDRRRLENVSWNDVPTVGIVFHPVVIDGNRGIAELAIKDKDAAARFVNLMEELADTCR